MAAQVIPICIPGVDFNTFLGVGQEILGFNLAHGFDVSHLRKSDIEKWLSCLACFRDRNSPDASWRLEFLRHAYVSLLVVADERDMIDILSVVSGTFVVTETVHRGVMSAVISGSLQDWKESVISGTSTSFEYTVRSCFMSVMRVFQAMELGKLWSDYDKKDTGDKLICLEYHG